LVQTNFIFPLLWPHQIQGLEWFWCGAQHAQVIKLSIETSLKSQASDWLKWRPSIFSPGEFWKSGQILQDKI
jgi:hypothetical protein